MKYAIILTIVITITLISGFIFLASRRSPAGSVAGKSSGPIRFTAEHSSFDFGQISMAKGKVSHTFRLANTTNEPESIAEAETSCMCTEAMLKLPSGERHGPFGMPGHGGAHHHMSPVTVKPGESVEVEAIFDPAAHGPAGVGKVDRTVTVKTTEGRSIQLAFTAEVKP